MEQLTPSALAMLLLELLKYLIRFVMGDSDYDFPGKFYLIALPVLNILVLPLMALLMPDEFQMPTDWVEFGRLALLTLVNALVSVLLYNNSIKPLKEYTQAWLQKG